MSHTYSERHKKVSVSILKIQIKDVVLYLYLRSEMVCWMVCTYVHVYLSFSLCFVCNTRNKYQINIREGILSD